MGITDIVVTVPKNKWEEWLSEGDLSGEPESGGSYLFWLGKRCPRKTGVGDRCYIVCNGKLRGYAEITALAMDLGNNYAIERCGGAIACTIDEKIKGFRGFRYRWWKYEDEKPFPEWKKL